MASSPVCTVYTRYPNHTSTCVTIILQPMIFPSQAPRDTQSAGGATPHFRYSSLSQEPAEWKLELERPCSGEQTLLMFDRWNKLFKGFYSEKKGKFDISKIPDIYVSHAHILFTVIFMSKCMDDVATQSSCIYS